MYAFRRKGPATVRAERLPSGNWTVEFRSGLRIEYPNADFMRLYEPADHDAIEYCESLKDEKTHLHS